MTYKEILEIIEKDNVVPDTLYVDSEIADQIRRIMIDFKNTFAKQPCKKYPIIWKNINE